MENGTLNGVSSSPAPAGVTAGGRLLINSIYTEPGYEIGFSTTESVDPGVRLNIGGGEIEIQGYTNIDRKNGKEAHPLPDYADSTVDEIYASHVLEHFGREQLIPVLQEWFRVLKPGGRIRIAVPDLGYICRAYVEEQQNVDVLGYLVGGQTHADDFHKNMFDEYGLRCALALAGFVCMHKWKAEYPDCSQLPVSLNVGAYKPTSGVGQKGCTSKIHAVMSMPRLAMTENFACAVSVLMPAQIPLTSRVGAYYNQCMEWGIEEAERQGADWVLTIDYDTIFNAEILGRLILLFDNYKEFDALVPCQVRREADYCLFNVDRENSNWKKLNYYDVFPVTTGHFGLTLIRLSALKKMDKPWFQCVPAPEGKGWADGRIDGDMNFWKKFRAAGNTIGLASRVSVGHLQQLVTWPDALMHPIHQYAADFRESGPPANARH
jgi:hypothetical protein